MCETKIHGVTTMDPQRSEKMPETRSWIAKLLRNSGWMALAQGSRAVEALVRSVIIARALSVEGFAAYVVALAFVSLVTELANLNVGAVIVTYGTRYREAGQSAHLKALLKVGYLVTLVTGVVATLASAILLALYYDMFVDYPGLYGAVVLLGGASAISQLNTTNNMVLRLIDKYKMSCAGDLFILPVNLAILFLFLYLGEPTLTNAIYVVALCLVLSGLTSSLIAGAVSLSEVGNWFIARPSTLAGDARSMIRMAIGSSLSMSMQRAIRKGDVLLLAALAPGIVVGFYDIGKKLADVILLLRDSLSQAAFPQIASDIAGKRFAHLRLMLIRLMGFGVPIAGLIWLGAWVLAEPLVVLFYGKKFAAAAPVLVILVLGNLLFVLFFWANATLLSGRRVKVQMFSTAVGLVLLGLSGWLLVPVGEEVGMAWAVVMATIGQFAVVALAARKILMMPDGEGHRQLATAAPIRSQPP